MRQHHRAVYDLEHTTHFLEYFIVFEQLILIYIYDRGVECLNMELCNGYGKVYTRVFTYISHC